MTTEVGVFGTVTSCVPAKVVRSGGARLEVELETPDGRVVAVWTEDGVALSAPADRAMTRPLDYPPAWRTVRGDRAIHPMSEGRIVDVEYVTPDRMVQRSTFANGSVVTVNFGDSPFVMADGYALRPCSHRFERTRIR